MTHPYDPGDEDTGHFPTVGPEPRGRWLGDALITIGGADKTALRPRSPDRGYFIGVGSGLLFTATLSALSMTLASSIAFGVPFGSAWLNVLGVAWFALILGLDRWLVSDPVGGFVKPVAGTASVVGAWLGHAVVELFKISPRILIALISSVLFARFVLLAVYDHEIQAQLIKLQVQQQDQFQQQVDAYAQNIKDQASNVIGQANAAEKKVQDQYDYGQKQIAGAYKALVTGTATANKNGIYCYQVPTYTVATNPNTGLQYNLQTGSYEQCPPPISGYQANYAAMQQQYPETQQQITNAKTKIANQYGVPAAVNAIKTAAARAKAALTSSAPTKLDGLLAREHALQLLTNKPAGTCPQPPTAADIATNDACISLYSPGAAAEMKIFQYFLLAFEMMPVLMKLINSLTKRRAYAWEMAAREESRRQNAQELIGKAKKRAETNLAAYVHRERVRLEEMGALEEYRLREVARQRRRLGLRRIRSRVAAVVADNQASRGLRDRVRRRKDGQPDNVVAMSDYVDPRNAQADPGLRVINSEDFLW
jgi:hypothetical protein